MPNKISCREGVYGGWEAAAEYLPKAGIQYIELQVREVDALKTAADGCNAKGVTPLTIAGGVDCDDQASIDKVKAACEVAKEIDVHHYFLSAKGEDRAKSMNILHDLGVHARDCDVTLCLETHPPFCLNGDEMLKTMSEVNQDNVRINFDTANVFYYNENTDSADELDKAVQYVASVHLKDTDGGFKSGNFPVFGEGVVQFKRIFQTLHHNGFDGPLTMELEGNLMKGLDNDGRHEKVVGCMDYLKSIGEA
ncbi:MAG: sugar phosphate isomerase/epimerase [Planctomycetes bacterium]|nr:sugar phosphate isomerase/epimerase [Planctomycetota bacterium]